jgi:hypothetical protein
MAKSLIVTPRSVEVAEIPDDFDAVKEIVGTPFTLAPYPRQYQRKGLVLMVNERGIYLPLAYNRWGIVGNFIVKKKSSDGKQLSMTDNDTEQAKQDLEDRDGGYLDEASGVLSEFREPFRQHGIPPAGFVPQAGKWFADKLPSVGRQEWVFRLPETAKPAEEWEGQGNDFDPELHFTGAMDDRKEVKFVQRLLDRHGSGLAAYFCYQPLPGMFSLELQFHDRQTMLACRREYQKGPTKKSR